MNIQFPPLWEYFPIDSTTLPIAKCRVSFDPWLGVPLTHTFGGKPLIDVGGKPMFAELAIMHLFIANGWEARWLESYARGQRNIVCLSEWADRKYAEQTECPITDERIREMLYGIAELNGGTFSGCWDVLAWKGDKIICAESKRLKRDKINDNQVRWLQHALRYGLTPQDFLVVEWEFGSVR